MPSTNEMIGGRCFLHTVNCLFVDTRLSPDRGISCSGIGGNLVSYSYKGLAGGIGCTHIGTDIYISLILVTWKIELGSFARVSYHSPAGILVRYMPFYSYSYFSFICVYDATWYRCSMKVPDSESRVYEMTTTAL